MDKLAGDLRRAFEAQVSQVTDCDTPPPGLARRIKRRRMAKVIAPAVLLFGSSTVAFGLMPEGGGRAALTTGGQEAAGEHVLANAAALGPCEERGEGDHVLRVPLSGMLLESDRGWVRASNLEVGSRASDDESNGVPVVVVSPEVIVANDYIRNAPLSDAGEALPARLAAGHKTALRLAADSGNSFLLSITLSGGIGVIVAVGADGDIAFVGECQFSSATEIFDRFLRTHLAAPSGTAATVLEAIVANPESQERRAFLEWITPKPPPAWIDLPPDERGLDSNQTPKEILDRLRTVRLEYDIPREWKKRADLVIAAKTSISWVEGTNLTVLDTEGRLRQGVSALPGEPLEVWLLKEEGGSGLRGSQLFQPRCRPCHRIARDHSPCSRCGVHFA